MSDTALPRPRQVTMAAWMIIAGSVLVVLTVFDRMAGMNSLDTRESVELFLSEPPGDGLGLTVPDVIGLLRVLTMVAGACAAAAAILGIHVLRRHKGARLGLTILAAPLFLTGFATGGFLSSVVAAASVMLWLEPARDWFAGRPSRERPPGERSQSAGRSPGQSSGRSSRDDAHERRSQPQDSGRPDPFAAPPVSSGPRPHQGFGTHPSSQSSGQSSGESGSAPAGAASYAPSSAEPAPYDPAPYDPARWSHQPHAGGTAGRRPGGVLAAAIVTWVTSGLISLLLAMSALVLLASPEVVMEEAMRANPALGDTGVTQDALQVGVVVTAVLVVLWSVAASTFAALMLRRREWARISLLISAVIAGVLCVVSVLVGGGFVMLVPLGACAATISLLLRRDVRSWVSAS